MCLARQGGQGLADEIVAYVAPVLIGGRMSTIGDLGIPTIDAALRFEFTAVEHLGDDLVLTLRIAGAPPTSQKES